MNREVVNEGIVAQTEQVTTKIKAVPALADCGLEDMIKVNRWLNDPRDFSSFNAVFERHFPDRPPARSRVQSRPMIDAKVEIDVLTYKPLAGAEARVAPHPCSSVGRCLTLCESYACSSCYA